MSTASTFAVAICTCDRDEQLHRTLDALEAQRASFPLLVVDQSPAADWRLAQRASEWPALVVVRDSGRGLSRARNIAAQRLDTEWIAYVDDDCLVEPDWAEVLAEAIKHQQSASMITGPVLAYGQAQRPGYQPVSVRTVPEERLLRGRWLLPYRIGLGVCFVVRRQTVERLGGWDERLGPGVERYPASDDMDFNYRFTRAGEAAHLTPSLRVRHDQWRTPGEIVALYEGYSRSWAGFAIKHLRTGDPVGGVWLWLKGIHDAYRMTGSAVKLRSRWRAAAAAAKWRGLYRGTLTAIRDRW